MAPMTDAGEPDLGRSGGDATCPEEVPEALSRMPAKRWFYAREAYFREAWSEAARRWPRAVEPLRAHAFILFKPDGIAARCVDRALACLEEAGFDAVHHARFRFHRHTIRELWRYELNAATLQRLEAIDVLLPASESLLVFLRDGSGSGESAADRLRHMKGPALVHLRQPHHLRSRIGAGTGLLNLIHTPDEPADVIREMGVLLDPDERGRAFAAMDGGAPSGASVRAAAELLYEQALAHDLDFNACAARMEAACTRVAAGPAVEKVREGCREARRAGPIDWRSILGAADAAGLPLTKWDRIVFAAGCTETNVPGVQPLLKA